MDGTERFGEKCLKTVSIAAIKLGSSHLSKGGAQPSGMDHSCPSFSSRPSHYFYKTSWNKHNFYNSGKLGWKQSTKLGLKQNETPKWITNCLFFFSSPFTQLLQSIPVGVGQVYGCDNPWTGGIFLLAVFISSPLICLHAAIGSAVGMLAGKDLICVTAFYRSTENKGGSGGTGTFTVTNLFSIEEWLLEKEIPTSVLRILLIDFRILWPHFMTAETFRGK